MSLIRPRSLARHVKTLALIVKKPMRGFANDSGAKDNGAMTPSRENNSIHEELI